MGGSENALPVFIKAEVALAFKVRGTRPPPSLTRQW